MDIKAMATFRRFEVAEPVKLKIEEIVARLEKRKFLPLTDAKEETERFGWITVEHLFDTRFDIEKVIGDPYVCFALRIDKRKIPQNLVKAHMKIEEMAYLEATGKKVGPAKRKEIREQVRLKLCDKVLPTAASYQVIWHPNAGLVWFGNTGEKACEAFIQHFEDTFDVALVAQTPRHLALRILEGDATGLDRTAPTSFSKEMPAYQLAAAQ